MTFLHVHEKDNELRTQLQGDNISQFGIETKASAYNEVI